LRTKIAGPANLDRLTLYFWIVDCWRTVRVGYAAEHCTWLLVETPV
jgi:hypothetical protein